jgi:TetR/AcrR family transcriptional regulator
MASSRRLGVETSDTRGLLIEAADYLLVEEGYHAISARRVAERAGLKPQLVHYYFRTMDDLLLAVYQRTHQEYLKLHERALASSQPLRALWKLNSDTSRTKKMIEFIAAGSQREQVRAEAARTAEYFRSLQVLAVAHALKDVPVDEDVFSPTGIATLMAAISRLLVMEAALGISLGHAELRDIVTHFLDMLEPRSLTPDK